LTCPRIRAAPNEKTNLEFDTVSGHSEGREDRRRWLAQRRMRSHFVVVQATVFDDLARLVDQRLECRLPLRDASPVFDRGRAFLDAVERGWRRRLRATERLRV